MLLSRVFALAAVVVVVAAAGCPPTGEEGEGEGEEGEGEEGEGEEGEGDVSLDDFCDDFATVGCAGVVDCGCGFDGRDFDAESCVVARADFCKSQLQPALDAGIVLDGDGADVLLAAVEANAAACDDVSLNVQPLDKAFFDPAPIGAACTTPVARCARGAGVCATSGCTAAPALGEPCVETLCGFDLACGADDRCVAVGAPVFVDEGGVCDSTASCAAGLACDDTGHCVDGPAVGDSCAGPSCASGDACVREFDNRVCGAFVVDGGDCFADADCDSGFCGTNRTCAPLPGDGDSCPDRRCAAGFTCDENDVVCVVPPGENEPCLIGNAACGAGLGCNADNICVPGPGVGEACLIPNNLCADGLGCDFTADGSICAVRRGVGADCQSDVCEDGLFCDFTNATCQPLRSVGTPCPDGGGCAAGDECGDLLGGFRCVDVPDVAGAACYDRCGGGFACVGDGGVCAPSICASR